MPTLHPDEPIEHVRRFLEAHPVPHGVPNGAALLTAVSGGADSLTLLFTLADLREMFGFSLHAAYLHHGMRAEADADAAMLRGVCASLRVPLHVGRADVPEMARARRVSLEVAGREARYAFLYQTAHAVDAFALCTGHTLDDQAETVLLRVIAGTGLEGLSGISPARRVFPPESPSPRWLFRPLLTVSRAETERFCASGGLTPVQDPANADPRYPRNRIRHELLPVLARDYNPAIREALSRLADLARADGEVLDQVAKGIAEVQPTADGGQRLHREPFIALPLAMRRRAARDLLRAAGASGRALGYENVERLREAIEQGSARCHLEGGLEFTCQSEHATLTPIRPAEPAPAFSLPLLVPGATVLPAGVLIAEIFPGNARSKSPVAFEAYLDADALQEPITVRNRRRGDRLTPLGLNGTRKLSDLLIDRKVPRAVRDSLPVVVSGDRIAWVAGVAVADGFRVTEGTRRMLRLRVTPPLFATF